MIYFGLTLVIVASYLGWFGISSCRDVADGGAVLRVSQPIGAPDIVLIGLVLGLTAALLWPELGELTIPGLFSIKRRVEELVEKGAQAEADIRSLTRAERIPDIEQTTEDANRRVLQAGSAQAFIVRPDTEPRRISPERAEAEAQLQALAIEIERFLDIKRGPKPLEALRELAAVGHIPKGDLYEYSRLLGRWELAFDTELRDWAVVRNQVVHFPERLTDEQVRAGVELGRFLMQSLREAFITGADPNLRGAARPGPTR